LEMLRDKVTRGGLSAFFDAAVRLVVTPEFVSTNADAISEAKDECIRSNSREGVMHAIDACINFDESGRISQITQPTLIISGKQDALTPIHLAQQIHFSIKGSEWKVMEGVGHNLLVSDNVSKIADIVMEFTSEGTSGS